MNRHYRAIVVEVQALPAEVVDRMAALYLEAYDGSSQSLFRQDLFSKDEVILLWQAEELVGFTTLRVFSSSWNASRVRVVYSGDTIVHPRHWGQQELAFSWISRIGEIKRSAPTEPLFWFLLVKGHRTFKYLPVFGKSFYPHWEIDRSDLKPFADHLASTMFGRHYNADTGVVEFPESRGHLNEALASPDAEDLAKPATQFFLKRNPGYRNGHELVCLCELELFNMKPMTARIFQRASRELASA